MNDHDLLVAGFWSRGDGLHAPSKSRVTLTPDGEFYELKITLGNGNTITAVLLKTAIKIARETKP